MPSARTRTLFDIGSDMLALEELMSEIGGEVTDEEVERAIDAFFAEIESDLHAKLDSYVYLIAEFNARFEMRRKEAERIARLAAVDQYNEKRLKRRLQDFFERTGKTKEETAHFKISVINNGGQAPLVLADQVDPSALEPRFQKVTVEVHTDAVRAALEAGEELEFADLGARGRHIRIK